MRCSGYGEFRLPIIKGKTPMQLLNLRQAATRLGISDATMRKLAPQLKVVMVGKRQKFRIEDVDAFILAGGSPKIYSAGHSIHG